MKQRFIEYDAAEALIPNGALLLVRPRWRLLSGVIAGAGRGVHCHAEMAVWDAETLCAYGTTIRHGGRRQALSALVRAMPGRIDVFPPNMDLFVSRLIPEKAATLMREIVGQPYGWRDVLTVGLLHLPVVRVIAPRLLDVTDDYKNGAGWSMCSGSIAQVYYRAGKDVVPNLGNRFVEPDDLARSPYFNPYRFTLIP